VFDIKEGEDGNYTVSAVAREACKNKYLSFNGSSDEVVMDKSSDNAQFNIMTL